MSTLATEVVQTKAKHRVAIKPGYYTTLDQLLIAIRNATDAEHIPLSATARFSQSLFGNPKLLITWKGER